MAAALAIVTAAPATAQPGGGDQEPITLTLQIADTPERQAAAAAEEFVALVTELSEGSITIVPEFGALSPATAVIDGAADLAMVPTRDWHALGVTSMDAFEAPFLVDNDALADEIARSPIAIDAMAGLQDVAVTGLALWPEDLRHLFAFEPSGKTFRTLADIQGAPILIVAGQPGLDLITTLGATVWQEGLREDPFTGDRHSDASSGALAGMVTGLWGAGLPIGDLTVVASDITLFSKFQMLVASTAALERLSPAHRDIILEAAERTRESAIERRASEAELALRQCSRGGRVIHAGADALAELKAAAAPVDEALRADPVTGSIIAAIDQLKSEVPAPAPAAPCDDASTIADESMFTDPTGYLGSVPPPGLYRAEITEEDLLSRGASPDFALLNAAVVTWEFNGDGTYTFESVDGACPGTMESKDGLAVMTEEPGNPCGLGGGILWREVPEGIVFALPFGEGVSVRDLVDTQAFFERIFTRIDGDARAATEEAPVEAALPPDGIYRTTLTAEELTAEGVRVQDVPLLDGVVTWTMNDGTFTQEWDEGPSTAADCYGTYDVRGDVVLVDWAEFDICWGSVEVRVTTTADGLDIEYVRCGGGIPEECIPENDRVLWTRSWSRIGDVPEEATLSGLPRPGAFRIEQSVEDLRARGVPEGDAVQLQGVVTITFDGERWSLEHIWGPDERSSICGGAYALEDGYLVLSFDQNPAECGTAPTYLEWRAADDGAATVRPRPGSEVAASIFTGEWTRVAEA
jgi:TRAP-type C4-dicarboxylate transport system substrate-binding protein